MRRRLLIKRRLQRGRLRARRAGVNRRADKTARSTCNSCLIRDRSTRSRCVGETPGRKLVLGKIAEYISESVSDIKQGERRLPGKGNMFSAYRSRIIIAFLFFSMTVSVTQGQRKLIKSEEPCDAATYYVKGLEDYRLGRYQQAVNSFKLAVQLKSDYVLAYNGIGVASMDLGLYLDAAEALEHAVRLAPSMTALYANLGLVYRHLGRFQEAVKAFQHALDLKPDYAAAFSDLGAAYNDLRQYKEAVGALKQAIRLDPGLSAAYNNLGCSYFFLGHYKEAIPDYEQAIRLESGIDAAHFNLGMVQVVLGNKRAALEQYETLMRSNTELAHQLYSEIYKNKLLVVPAN